MSQQFNAATENPAVNNRIRVQFPAPQTFQNCELALASLNVFFSWYNIQAAYGNNSFSYTWPTSTGTQTFTVVIPDGSYDVAGLNTYLQFVCQQNGTYLLDGGGNAVYYLTWVPNLTYLRTTLTATPLPATLPTSYSLPTNYPGGALASTSQTPQLIIPAVTSSLSSISVFLGFSAGSYPSTPSSSVYQINSQYIPEVDVVSTVNVSCDIVNNGLISPQPNVVYSFSPQVAFGSQISIQPPQRDWFTVVDSTYTGLTVTLTDQQGHPLPMQDPVWSATLLVRKL